MKFKTIKSIISLALCAVIMSCGYVTRANETDLEATGGDIMNYYTAITSTQSSLTISSSGKATCKGTTQVIPDYVGEVVVELQQYNGGWQTIMDWSDSDSQAAIVNVGYYVVHGYDYRVKTTHYAYNKNGKQVDNVTKYSKTVSY